jgi:FKBP-type peptidyl-prolyl cis-trans isomerase SlpA
MRKLMSNLPHPLITEGAYLTLHYRIAAGGDSMVSTFGGNPATLQLGAGQLAPFLEELLIGLPEGASEAFELLPEQAFGARNPDLVRRISRASLDQRSEQQDHQIGDLLEFVAPDGTRFAGVLMEVGEDDVVIDLNHPFAGRSLSFEVRIIAIL